MVSPVQLEERDRREVGCREKNRLGLSEADGAKAFPPEPLKRMREWRWVVLERLGGGGKVPSPAGG